MLPIFMGGSRRLNWNPAICRTCGLIWLQDKATLANGNGKGVTLHHYPGKYKTCCKKLHSYEILTADENWSTFEPQCCIDNNQ